MLGIVLNLVLFALKYIYADISGSISLKADALNNLMDLISSTVIVIGFKISAIKADREHPYGHGRMEYIAGLIISIIILFTGFNLAKDSIARMIHPEPIEIGLPLYIMLVAAIFGKVSISTFNFVLGRKINSNTLIINAKDSGSDVLATSAVLFSMLAFDWWGWQIDGLAGLLVSTLILYAGYQAAKETISTLMGEALSKKQIDEIGHFVMQYDMILGVHDIALHSYGVKRNLLTMHVEVDGSLRLATIHAEIDKLERKIMENYGFKTLMHVDPALQCDSKAQEQLRAILERAIESTGLQLHYTDFNCDKDGHYLYCDIYAPYELRMGGKELRDKIEAFIHEEWKQDITLAITVNRY